MNRKYTAKEIETILKIKPSYLRSLQRVQNRRKIGFKPDFEAKKGNEPNKYSYKNLIELRILQELRKLKMPREHLKNIKVTVHKKCPASGLPSTTVGVEYKKNSVVSVDICEILKEINKVLTHHKNDIEM